jgi:allantoicase
MIEGCNISRHDEGKLTTHNIPWILSAQVNKPDTSITSNKKHQWEKSKWITQHHSHMCRLSIFPDGGISRYARLWAG